MFKACAYDATGFVVESHGGRSAHAFVARHSGPNTLRISEPDYPGVEAGEVYPAGYNIDGTPPAAPARYRDEIDLAVATMTPANARAFVVRVMKGKARQALQPFRDAADTDFGDADLVSRGMALRDELKAIILSAAAATSESELRAAWVQLKEKV